ncbi:MAG TPA: helix-turn-helix transcriptional regulator [Longimicrobium sp.]|nr:helix-turn-helix transcriptional regulator [Longimicrobium sp.]
MIPLELQTPAEILEEIAERARALRLERGWSQAELARRAGINVETLRRFERTGKIALERLVMLAVVLGAVQPLGQLFPRPPVRTLDDLERRDALPKRAPRKRRSPGA